jgi:hypothetical protein
MSPSAHCWCVLAVFCHLDIASCSRFSEVHREVENVPVLPFFKLIFKKVIQKCSILFSWVERKYFACLSSYFQVFLTIHKADLIVLLLSLA